MRKFLLVIVAALVAGVSCMKTNNGGDGDFTQGLVFEENGVYYLGNGDQNYPVPVGDYMLDASKQYVLRGWVYIQSGSSLSIPAGTIVKGYKSATVKGSSLIVEPGGKLFARGTAQRPVVFTSDQPAGSRKPGDWGGLILCGKAKNNQVEMQIEGGPRTKHGGNDDNDSSGELSYVRVEFAGYPFQTDQEINGITFGSVGRGTVVHHVQVSYSNDDSFEWFGGSVSCKNLVAYHGWDDDFDTDSGFSGTMQFLLGVRHPKIADKSVSNGFESDNNSGATKVEPYTSARFCNVTLVGPIGQDAGFMNISGTGNFIDGGDMFPNNGSGVGQFQAGVQIRRNSHISLVNSVVTGYPVGLIIEDDKVAGTQDFATQNSTIRNVIFGGYTSNAAGATYSNSVDAVQILGSDGNKTWKDGLTSVSVSHTLAVGNGNQTTTLSELNLNSSWKPLIGSLAINASLAVPQGFDASGNGFAGAFRSDSDSDNWMKDWTNFNPQNTVY